MIEHSPSIVALMKALHAVQGAVNGVGKDSVNPHFRSRYASLENVVDTIRPACQDAGLVVIQAPGQILDGCLDLTTMIVHAESGEWMRSTMQIPLDKPGPQAAGSAMTYGERYSLMAVFNLPPTDDDAEATTNRAPPKRANGEAAKAPIPDRIDDVADYLAGVRTRIENFTTPGELNEWWSKEKRVMPDGVNDAQYKELFERAKAKLMALKVPAA
jgi:hypothetical protein